MQTGLSLQNRLIQNWLAMLSEAEPASSLIETHISWVLLSGQYAYKIKKALHTDFLDYSDPGMRRFYCREEIRLNRRTAPDIYLDVVQIGGTLDRPSLSSGPVLEYAVKMRQFDIDKQLDHLLEKNHLTQEHIDSLSDAISNFHLLLLQSYEQEEPSRFGSPEFVLERMLENLRELKVLLVKPDDLTLWEELKQSQLHEFTLERDKLENREKNGFVRECHGDMHMGNLVVVNGRVIPFDSIEFDAQYRWMDVISDVAFAFMDLLYFGKKSFAWRLLNHYLEQTGDYDGAPLLRFYASCHATVRAKVHLMRELQETDENRKPVADDAPYRRYMILANDLLKKRQSALVITMGLPGSGKTVFANLGAEKLPGICLHSDVERKRLFNELSDRYSEQSKYEVYDYLLKTADTLLQAGMTVIVDASFMKEGNRTLFHKLAQNRSVPFAIAVIAADMDSMKQRLLERKERDDDASDADVDVLMKLQEEWEPLTEAEKPFAVEFVNEGNTGFDITSSAWHALYDKLRIQTE
ncbi:AAA family ATPase [Oxalobacter formigenes]|uniref:bifunctional aminoglycoside phosphotransferase/ATP-binding protein n=1 Tax=Oxalobacter formigenes TaxID=847 RepID=UPI0022AF1043|nr:bifunctional aminoglycoside phosphotransferase/ATP-binding protein [Oxalobacter formigenes]WAW04992.1 AAA family ATPase [Oxalobacter formigenes]